MQKYVIVHFINGGTVPKEFPSAEWPLHITLLANFTITDSLETLSARIDDYAKQLKPFIADVEGEDLFGLNKNVPVSLIRPCNELKEIHQGLIRITKSLGAVYDEPKFTEEGFRPHATIQAESRLHEGQTVNISGFTLVDMFPDNEINKRRVIKDFELSHK